jgi:hypothetical protein
LSPEKAGDLDFLSGLHLDHNYEVYHICKMWKAIITKKASLQSWDDEVIGMLICHLLFGVRDHENFSKTRNPLWKANVRFRCGKRSQRHQRVEDDARHAYCHDGKNHAVLKQIDIETPGHNQ